MKHPKDPRPTNQQELVDKFRKVRPIDLASKANARSESAERTTTVSGLTPYSGEWGTSQVLHLLRRCLFGVTKSNLAQFESYSMDEAVAELLNVEGSPNPPVNNYSGDEDIGNDPDVALGSTWVEAPFNDEFEGPRIVALKGWWIEQMLSQQPTAHQKMMLFWHSILPIKIWDVFVSKACYQYLDMLHRNTFGNFRILIEEITKDPSMLLFLNGTYNHKDAPDENYARELQELFTVGKGQDSRYTEADVVSAARVLTGWVVHWEDFESIGKIGVDYQADWHDTGIKEFSEFYGNKVFNGQSSGIVETSLLMDMILETDECARYICRRIYIFFVNPIIDENVELNVIRPLAEVFKNNGFEIKPVLEILLKSEHFYDMTNAGVMIKSPADFLIGSLRTIGYSYGTRTPLNDYQYYAGILWRMANMGMELGDPPNVAGWSAYYQAPQYDKAWITTDTILRRAEVMDAGIFWGFWINPDLHPPFDMLSFVKQMQHPEDPVGLIQELSELLLGIQPSEEVFTYLRNILVPPELSDVYWTQAWGAYLVNPNEGNTSALTSRLNALFQQLFQMGEFQLM